jgi:autotransporter-associated beta strand protein
MSAEQTPVFNEMNTSIRIRLALAALVLAFLNLQVSTARATLRVWSGNAVMSNSWTNGPNWSLNIAPVSGDDLQFPFDSTKSNSNDNYTNGTTFNSIQFMRSGNTGNRTYDLGGNSIALNAGVSAINDYPSVWPNALSNAFLLNSNQTFSTGPYTALTFNGPINLNGNALTFDAAEVVLVDSPIDVRAIISGVGNLIKTNAGTLTLWSNNTYTGSTTLNAGTLAVNGLQPASAVVLNQGTLTGRGTVGTITSTGTGGPGSIVISPGANASLMTCSNVSLNAATTFATALSGPGVYNELIVHGTVALNNATLSVSLGFTPTLGEVFILISNDGADPVSGTFNGLPEGSSFYLNGNQFTISYAGFDGNDVVLTVTRTTLTWSGGGTNTYWTNPANWTANVAPSPGSDLVFPLGAAQLNASNNFPAGTLFNSITISGTNYSLSGSNILLSAGLNAANTPAQNRLTFPITLNADQAITTGNAGVNLYLLGDIDTSNRSLTISGDGNAQVSAVLRGSGGLVKSGNGLALLFPSNTFSGPVQILQGEVYIYNGHSLGDTSGTTTIASGATLALANSIIVPETLILSGTLLGNDPGQVWTGPVSLADPAATIITGGGASLAINALISGTNGFAKGGGGILTLNSNNTYTGTTAMNGGTLYVNGSQPASPILLSGGNLYGTGTVGTITVSTPTVKTLWPGPGVGILNASNVSMDLSTLFNIELDGPAVGSGYGQLNVHGSVSLNNATLSVLLGASFTPAVGESFTIINNDGQDPVTGTFNGLPEGASFTVGGAQFSIVYDGGDGNDVVIYRGNPPARMTSVTSLTNKFAQIQGVGISNLTYTIQAATNLNPTVKWTNVGVAPANASGIFSFTDTNAPLFPMRFYRAITP